MQLRKIEIEDYIFANDFLRFFDRSFKKKRKKSCFLKSEKKRKIRILEHWSTFAVSIRCSARMPDYKEYTVYATRILFCGRPDRSHCGVCPSVRTGSIRKRKHNINTETRIGANVPYDTSNRCTNVKLNGSVRGRPHGMSSLGRHLFVVYETGRKFTLMKTRMRPGR